MKLDGAPFAPGERFRNTRLATSLRLIAESGRDALYGGPLGQAIIKASHEQDGLLCEADLASHRVEWVEPLLVDYRGYTVAEMPPNAQGIAVSEALAILEHTNLGAMEFGVPEAVAPPDPGDKKGLADAATHVTDGRCLHAPIQTLLEAGRIESLHRAILAGQDPVRASRARRRRHRPRLRCGR